MTCSLDLSSPPTPQGTYRHYKGKLYRVIDIARSSEDLKEYVVYETLYDNPLGKLWIRSHEEFMGSVEFAGQVVPRFSRIK
ncbi:MAG: DUF1653 domain-containing protein [Bdellovibrionales bacterium]|nr:DUF1653 domain-containing protein [Bdellovibrionales bacterium]